MFSAQYRQLIEGMWMMRMSYPIWTRITQDTRLRRWFIHEPVRLGRWQLNYHPTQIENKVRRSNEDHSL